MEQVRPLGRVSRIHRGMADVAQIGSFGIGTAMSFLIFSWSAISFGVTVARGAVAYGQSFSLVLQGLIVVGELGRGHQGMWAAVAVGAIDSSVSRHIPVKGVPGIHLGYS